MKQNNYVLFALLILVSLIGACTKKSDTTSDNPDQKYISGDIWFNEGYNTLCKASDNGFALAARVGIRKIYIVKTNSSFEIQWSKTFGANIDAIGAIVESSDNGFVLVSDFIDTTVHPDKHYLDLFKLSSSGTIMWERRYPFNYQSKAGFGLRETRDKGFIITTGHNDFIELFKINSSGDSLWSQCYSDHSSTAGHDIQLTPDNGFITVGEGIIIKTDSVGTLQWDQFFSKIIFTNVRVLPDGSSIALGRKIVQTDTSLNQEDYVLMKFDQSGNKLWEQLYNVGNWESSANLCLTPEGGFIFTGMTTIQQPFNDEIVIIKTDEAGNKLSSKVLDLDLSPQSWGLVYQNGSYVFFGGTTLPGSLAYYLLLMKFNM
jgi:hypothetical protein